MKLKCLVLLLAVCLLTVSCAFGEGTIRIGVMSGPTGMGMAQLMSMSDETYQFEIYSAPTNATADLASGALDMLCLPTNTAAALASKKADYISVLAINCLGSLYLVTDDTVDIQSIGDLEGLTVWASVPTSTTAPILAYLFEQNHVNTTVEWEADHDALAARVIAGDVHVAVLPEPKATVAMSQAEGWRVALNLSAEWDKVCESRLPMGCIVATNTFIAENQELVNRFLADYSTSIAFIGNADNADASAQMIADAGILPKAGIAKKALGNLYGSIVYEDNDTMKSDLQAFYAVIGQEQPDDAFYYHH